MGSCGAVFWNKINSFRKSANNPTAQKKMIYFSKKLNFVPSLKNIPWAPLAKEKEGRFSRKHASYFV